MPQLHILQHKSWHVYNQENRDKVSRDEEKARKEEEEKEQKTLRAESEHRLNLLRKKAQERLEGLNRENITGSESTVTASLPSIDATEEIQTKLKEVPEQSLTQVSSELVVASLQPKPEHINFWAEYEKKPVNTHKGNPEYEADKKKEQDKWDRQITKYLGDVVKGKDPWYAKEVTSSDTVQLADGSQKVRQDPLSSINKYIAKKKKDKDRQDLELMKQSIEKERLSKRRKDSSTTGHKRDREEEAKPKKEKKSKHKHKRSSKDSSKSEKPSMFTPEVQKLREEWFEKEKQRRERAERLIEYEKESSRPKGRYYSQYNPREERHSKYEESSSSQQSYRPRRR
ncbi:hypothetical protein K7432_015898 [Basidiobolus ranarum]|uniref:CBF1-interacting co-repressor CIR N-terminal domain-containing protein n=1 Tax=Basidiobolus ranarum TaxID=34480 RepID=A0ABR2WFM9_9FUNG